MTRTHTLTTDEADIVYDVHGPLPNADGRPPFQWTKPPAMVADFEAQCVLGDDRLWRFQSHVLRPIFVGSDLPASISIDPRRL